MGGDNELAAGKEVCESFHDDALPAGVEVEFDFVHEDEADAFEGVEEGGVGDGEASGEVTGHGNKAFFAIRELEEIECFLIFLEGNLGGISADAEAVAFKSGDEAADDVAGAFELGIAPCGVVDAVFIFYIFAITNPVEKVAEIDAAGEGVVVGGEDGGLEGVLGVESGVEDAGVADAGDIAASGVIGDDGPVVGLCVGGVPPSAGGGVEGAGIFLDFDAVLGFAGEREGPSDGAKRAARPGEVGFSAQEHGVVVGVDIEGVPVIEASVNFLAHGAGEPLGS